MRTVFVPFLGDFFSISTFLPYPAEFVCFRPLSRGLFFNGRGASHVFSVINVFVPFLGDFFSIACLRSPSPSALASAFAAGMGKSLHQALSFGDEMPIFPVRAGIGGDGNEKWCCLIPSTHPCFQTSGFRVQGSGLWWRLRRKYIWGRCPKVAFKSPVTSHSRLLIPSH